MAKRILTVEAINERLKGTGIQLEQRGKKLSLRAMLPSRDGLGTKQARISLGLSALFPVELEQAEAKAWQLHDQKTKDLFRWEDWSGEKAKLERITAGDWVERYHKHRMDQGLNAECWKRHYWSAYKNLDMDKPLTEANILGAVLKSKPNTSNRKHICNKLRNLADFAGMTVNLKPYEGNYSQRKTKARDLPTEEEIIRARDRFLEYKNKVAARRWQNVFGLLATYGLRPHEAFYCQIDTNPPYACKVFEGKTGSRTVMPLYPEWAVRWRLWDIELPETTAQTHWEHGHRVCKAMNRYIDFPPYNLRHAYAIRGSVKFKIPVRIVAGMMGHSPEIHLATYSKYLKDSEALEVYLAIAEKDDRPKPRPSLL